MEVQSSSLLRSVSLATGVTIANPSFGQEFQQQQQSTNKRSNGEATIHELRQALEHANTLIGQQNDLILKQASRILKQEGLLSSPRTVASSITSPAHAANTYMKDCEAMSQGKERNMDSGGTSASEQSEETWRYFPSPRSERGASASRRRTEALEMAKLHGIGIPSPEKQDSPTSALPTALATAAAAVSTANMTVTAAAAAPTSTANNARGGGDNPRGSLTRPLGGHTAQSVATTAATDWTTVSSAKEHERDLITPTNASTVALSSTGKKRLFRSGASPTDEQQSTSTSSSTASPTYSEPVSDVSSSPPLSEQLGTTSTSPLASASASASAGPPKGLAARLAMGSKDRRRMAGSGERSATSRVPHRLSVSPCSEAPLTDAAAEPSGDELVAGRSLESDYVLDSRSPSTSPCAPFAWRSAAAAGEVYLFIAHDNPQVGATVATRLKTEGPMHVMLESKEDSGLACILLGSIVYSGRIEEVEGADLRAPRGSQFIVCSKMSAFTGDIKDFPTRVRGDISEIDLDGCGPQGRVDVSTGDQVSFLLKQCTSRVDVILDPMHAQLWYPYWEGRRKMAPQFRSQGVGYLRLGDDMSRYGSAFLSLDGGCTFLDDGATSIVATGTPMTTMTTAMFRLSKTFPGSGLGGPTSASPTSAKASGPASGRRPINHRRLSVDVESGDEGSDGEGFAVSQSSPVTARRGDVSLSKELADVRETLQLLSEPDSKWAERVEALRRMHNAIINITSVSVVSPSSGSSSNSNSNIPEALLTEIISAVTASITKQKNPHVLRSAVCCVRVVGGYAAGTASCGVAWRTLVLETVHLLRSSTKAVYEEAKDALVGLHCGAAGAARWTLSMSTLAPLLGDVLAGPRGRTSGGASNTAKVVQWLEILVSVELDCLVEGIGSGAKAGGDKIDVTATFQKCQHLLVHREEASRDAVVSLCGVLLVMELMQQAGVGGWENLCTLSEMVSAPTVVVQKNPIVQSLSGPRSRSSTPTRGLTEEMPHALVEALLAAVGLTVAHALQEATKAAPRMYERVLASAHQCLVTKVTMGRKLVHSSSTSRSKHTTPTAATSPSEGIAFRDRATSGTSGSGVLSASKSAPLITTPGGSASGGSSARDSRRSPFEGTAVGAPSPEGQAGLDQINRRSRTSPPTSSAMTNTSPVPQVKSGVKTKIKGQGDDQSCDKRQGSKVALTGEWFEARLLLKTVPVNTEGWTTFSQVVRSASSFYQQLNVAAAAAQLPRAALLRIVLPFDEDTSSSDQAHIHRSPSSATPSPRSLSVAGVDGPTLLSLQHQAIALRKLIRVKMADEADLMQAQQATALLQSFCVATETLANDCGKSPSKLVREFEKEMM